MKLFVLIIFIFIIKIYPQTINKGWNLIGVDKTTSLENIIKEDKYITKALFYKDGNWTQTANIDSSDGIWIYSEKKFNKINTAIKYDIKNYVSLKKGWNLKSIPMNKNVSPYIINKSIYSYSNKRWMSFNKNNKEITKLQPNDGFWVNSREDINISLKDIKLIKADFNNNNELKQYIENIIINNKQFRYDYNYGDPILENDTKTTSSPSSGASTDNKIDATSTNLQEKDVDEIDVIKHNGKEIYFIQNGIVYKTSFEDILLNKKAIKEEIKFNDKNLRSYGMYLYKEKLIVFSNLNNNNNIIAYSSITRPSYYNDRKVYIDIFDISSSKLLKIKQYEIDGNIFTSRISNNQLYIINSFYPNYKVEYEKIENECENIIKPYRRICYNIDYNKYKILSKSILPKIKSKGEEKDIVLYNNFYINPIKTNNLNIISVFSIDLETNSFKNSSSIDGNVHNFYASSDYVYLVSSNNLYRSYFDYQIGSKIYAFSIKDKISFNGETNIKGRINNKFSLSEYNGNLRVVTTQGNSWRDDTNNTLFIINNNKIISSIESLGKKGETVKAVRFFKDKAFVVTFKQTDPLYILDLSNPNNPTKVSELEIPGFSTYFHYIDKDHLLSIGRDADEEGRIIGLQLQLFNISNLSSPYLQDKLKLGDTYSYSSALYESKAFVYSDSNKLLSIDFNNRDFRGFKVFKIDDKINFIQDVKKDKNSKNYYGNYSSILFNKSNENYIGYINDENIQTNKIRK